MTLRALRVAILGDGPWLMIRDEKNLDRLRNTSRQRGLTSDALNRGVHELSQLPLFYRLWRGAGARPTEALWLAVT